MVRVCSSGSAPALRILMLGWLTSIRAQTRFRPAGTRGRPVQLAEKPSSISAIPGMSSTLPLESPLQTVEMAVRYSSVVLKLAHDDTRQDPNSAREPDYLPAVGRKAHELVPELVWDENPFGELARFSFGCRGRWFQILQRGAARRAAIYVRLHERR